MKRLFLLLIPLVLPACGLDGGTVDLNGRIMGTTWSVRAVTTPGTSRPVDLSRAVEQELRRLDGAFSTYIDNSEISRFNRHVSGEWFPVSAETASVVYTGLVVSHRSDGAFDVAVGPLVDRWGFGPQGRPPELPSPPEIRKLLGDMAGTGFEVRLSPPALRKLIPGTRLDLSAIAKGYAVDAMAGALDQQGWTDYLVEIGGEVRARGHRADGRTWRVAVESPDAPEDTPLHVIALRNAAVATSGSYRNHYEIDGRRYSHTIDPRTGRPVEHALVSASVIAENAMLADAWATAMNVLGPDAGVRLAEREGLAVSLVWHEDGRLEEWLSPTFRDYLEGEPVDF